MAADFVVVDAYSVVEELLLLTPPRGTTKGMRCVLALPQVDDQPVVVAAVWHLFGVVALVPNDETDAPRSKVVKKAVKQSLIVCVC
jgi:hypothetical protein